MFEDVDVLLKLSSGSALYGSARPIAQLRNHRDRLRGSYSELGISDSERSFLTIEQNIRRLDSSASLPDRDTWDVVKHLQMYFVRVL